MFAALALPLKMDRSIAELPPDFGMLIGVQTHS